MPINYNNLQGIWEIIDSSEGLRGKMAIKNNLICLMTYAGMENIECECGDFIINGTETQQIAVNPNHPEVSVGIIEITFENDLLTFTLNGRIRKYRRIINVVNNN